MRIVPISDVHAPELADYTSLTDVALRRVREPANGLYLAESTKVISRALRAGHAPRSLLMHERWLNDVTPLLDGFPDVPVFVGSEEQLESLTGFHLHRGALASMHRPQLPSVEAVVADARLVVILEDIVDHTNVGAIFRSAAALGADAVLVTPRCADPLYRRSVRVSMGTVLGMPWTRLPEWSHAVPLLHEAGFTLAALTLGDGAVALRDYAKARPDRVAIVLGTEGDGLSKTASELADDLVTVPMMRGVDSLNVAAASAVAIYALAHA